jgi:hypothetical protein
MNETVELRVNSLQYAMDILENPILMKYVPNTVSTDVFDLANKIYDYINTK